MARVHRLEQLPEVYGGASLTKLPTPVVLPVVAVLEPVVRPVVLPLDIAVQPAVLSPAHVVIVVRIGMLMLQPVVSAVMLSLQPVVLAIMTVGIAGIVCRCGRCKRGCRDRECRREEILTHLSLLFLDPRKLREVR